MRKRNSLIGIALPLFAALACNLLAPDATESAPVYIITEVEFVPTPTNLRLPASEAEVPRISLDRALVAFTAGEAVFVDVRSADAYAASHVAGAVSIPLTNIEIGVSNLSLKKDQWIITYCT
jgi:hypothetical protein